MKNLVFFFCLVAFLMSGCKKDPGPDVSSDKIVIPVIAKFTGLTVKTCNLKISIDGCEDLFYPVTPNTEIYISIENTKNGGLLGRSATLVLETKTINGDIVCYNYVNGIANIASLQLKNNKIEWLGEVCEPSSDKIFFRVKVEYTDMPGMYNIIENIIVLASDNVPEEEFLCWTISNNHPNIDTLIIIEGEIAAAYLNHLFSVNLRCQARDMGGNVVNICSDYEDNLYIGGMLLPDNPKITFSCHDCRNN